jgi:regulator of sigma E protease
LAVNSKFDTRTETLLVPSFERAVELGVFEVSGIALSPVKGSPAERFGMKDDDRLVSVEGTSIASPAAFVETIRSHTADADGVQLVISRSGAEMPLSIMPADGKIGAYVTYADVKAREGFVYRYPFGQAVVVAAKETVDQTTFTFELLFEIVRRLVVPKDAAERQDAAAGVGGPIAIGGLFVQLVSAKVGISVILTVVALLSINLGAFNLLPFPALDGGRFFMITLLAPLRGMKSERVRNIENTIHSVGFSILILIAIIVAFHDVWKLIS